MGAWQIREPASCYEILSFAVAEVVFKLGHE